MKANDSPFTVTTLVAAAAEILEEASFRAVGSSATSTWKATEARVYEDAYSIVCIAVYETWTDLSSLWEDDQANLVGLISKHFTRTEAKAWDGYLVLLTPSVVPTDAHQEAIDIQRNTLHVRKLFAAGDELETVNAIHRTLLPLLPLKVQEVHRPSNVLHSLPPLLASHDVDEEASKTAIAAFLEQRPIIEAIHDLIADKRER